MDPAQVLEAGLLSRFKTIQSEPGDSEVQQFYDGRTVFITGGSGFLGKQLIEKLFRATNVHKIFMLIRPKKGKLINERLHEILADPVYDMVRTQKSIFEDKLVPIAGDVAELRLGMSDEDWNTVAAQTEIIFHVAATTRFDEGLRLSTLINVRGTREVLALGIECTQLKSFVHVSTAFSHVKFDQVTKKVLEKFYQSPVDPEALIKLIESTEESRLKDITPGLIKGWPNTYTFTKAVTEELVQKMGRNLPLCMMRPAIVICAYREPSPGWLDISNIYGASGFVLGAVLGILHVVYIKEDVVCNYVPVDYVNNATIVAAWKTAKKKGSELLIYSIASAENNKFTYGNMIDRLQSVRTQYGVPDSIGYAFSLRTVNPIIFIIYTLLMHIIPGYMIDAVLFIMGRKRMATKIYNKVYRLSKALSFYMLHQVNIEDKNLVQLYEKLSPRDQEIFKFDMNKIDWSEYILVWGMGLRKYIIKDGLTRTEYGNKKQRIFRILMFFVVPLYFYVLYKILYFGISGVITLFYYCASLIGYFV